ncbi:hypothetical protein CHS0354_015513 [Potamilus streckersoni]|uniref:C2H2-type domain-containing protein n=1 Tax=Potamilus streckersoni TaxID=2493646 RepID=A0AAE0VVB0_9BIVA|nr:hypothetical protein CHS0354_015513 [Potamilus streckersoni]
MDTKEWKEMTLDNAADIVYVAAEKLKSVEKNSIQRSKDLGKRGRLQTNSDTLNYSGLSSNVDEDLFSSVNRNYKSNRTNTANEIASCVKPAVKNGLSFTSTSDSQTVFEPRPSDSIITNSKKEQAMSKIVSDKILNEEFSGIIRHEMCVNSTVPGENGQESIISTSTFNASSHSVDDSSEHNKEDSLLEQGMRVDKADEQSKDAKTKKKERGQKNICQICNRVLSTLYTLKRHLQMHTKDGLFCCRSCGSKFKTLKCLKRHARTHVEKKIFECEHCGEKFTSKNYLSIHILKHSDNPLNRYQFSCSVCKREFLSKYNLQMHSKVHSDETSYTCKVCGKVFMSPSGLRNHKNTHTGKDMYSCDHCGKSFPRFADLEKHIRIHTGERPFQCDMCDKTYKTYGDLNVHMRKHIPDPKFQCNICGKFCLQSGDLMKHKVNKHGESNAHKKRKI